MWNSMNSDIWSHLPDDFDSEEYFWRVFGIWNRLNLTFDGLKYIIPTRNNVLKFVTCVLTSWTPNLTHWQEINIMTWCTPFTDVDGGISISCEDENSTSNFSLYYSRENLVEMLEWDTTIADSIEGDPKFQAFIIPVIQEIYRTSWITMQDDAVAELFTLYKLKNSGDIVNWAVYAVNMVDLYVSVPYMEEILLKYGLYPNGTPT